jgi:Spy/CpxP family protein refolding chaperone
MSVSILLLVAGLLAWRPAVAAMAGKEDPNRFFGLTNLWTIHLTLTPQDWSAMEPEEQGGPGRFHREYPWSSCLFECAGRVLTNVAVRFKGNSSFNRSRGSQKRPLKLDFNRGYRGRSFLGLTGLSLNNNFNDATQLREALAYETYRQAGVPAPRTAFARVYLTLVGRQTNECLGLYTLVEPVNGSFLKARFGTKRGLLLKPERLAGLEYLGEDWRDYTNRYEPKSEVPAADAARFISLTRHIARADDATLEHELPARLDLDEFLRYVAVTAVLANYDSFVGNGHNYYLFQPTGENKAVFIPWDLNEAFGGHPMLGSRPVQAGLSALRPQAAPNRLIERVLANPRWAAAYRREVAAVLTNACAPARLRTNAEQIAGTVQATVFAESAPARNAFQRIALGQTNLPPPEPQPGEGRPGPRLGPLPGFEEMSLANWINLRVQNVADELAGKRTAEFARLRPFPGGPAGPLGPNLAAPGGPPRPGRLEPGPRPPGPPGDPMAADLFPPDLVMRNQEQLGLSPEQRESIEADLEQSRPRLDHAEQRMREEADKLRSLLNGTRVDSKEALAQSDRLADAEKELRRLHLELLVHIKNCLTPAQQVKLKAYKATR